MRVVVVGGGFAGLAAAVALQEARHEVTLLERRGVLGGRATSYRDAVSAEDVDNGTHLMIAAYTETLDLCRRAGAGDLLQIQDDLEIDYLDERGFSSLRAAPWPAPFHLLGGLLGLRLPWSVRWAAVRLGWAVAFSAPPRGLSLAEYFRQTGQGGEARRLLWDPLATAILNETPERAAAMLFYNVYREAFLRRRAASRLVFLRRGYGVLHERLARYFVNRGGRLERRALAEGVLIEGGRASGVSFAKQATEKDAIRRGRGAQPATVPAEAVVLAVPWHAVPPLVPEPWRSGPPFPALAQMAASPIVSIEVWLDRVVLDRVMVGLRDSEVEWVFDKGRLFGRSGAPQHLAFIVSAARRSAPRRNADLVASAVGTLRRFLPAMAGARVERSLVLREPQATFASDPEAESRRPPAATPVPGLFLAGDWTSTGLPATIEGAVRSGRAAARAVQGLGAP